jgi:osmotically-inducible protein OsmY
MAALRRIGWGGGGLRPRRRAGPAAALALLLAGSLWLSGCAEVLLGAAATTGLTVAEERSVGTAVDDLTIRGELNHIFFQENIDLYQDVSFSVIEGRVLLKGSVPTPEDRVRALQLAWQADGVREVINEIQVTDESGLLDFARDTLISTQLKAKLLFDGDVLSINYSVETVNGTVYIMGIAQNEAELERVMEYARDIGGVKRVVSHVVMKDDPRRQATP